MWLIIFNNYKMHLAEVFELKNKFNLNYIPK